jgi:hypothetical protein
LVCVKSLACMSKARKVLHFGGDNMYLDIKAEKTVE